MARQKQVPTKNPKKWIPRPVKATMKKKEPLVPGSKCPRDPKRYLKTPETVIGKACFAGLCRDILQDIAVRFSINPVALLALQDASEKTLVSVLSDANLCAEHAGRITVTPSDLRLAMRLRGE